MKQRSAGILLPVFSLPSPYGIGDVGPELIKFADFLARAGQRYWQILPLNPTSKEKDHSPYNSISSMAGNPLFISPDLLREKGLLDESDIAACLLPAVAEADYENAECIKNDLLNKAYERFRTMPHAKDKQEFGNFCDKEVHWLDDFALFVVIKRHLEEKEWSEWPDAYKKRDTATLATFSREHDDELKKIKWQQFIIAQQWRDARQYCNKQSVQIFGDLSFYVSYDSADVWAHPELFCLDEHGAMTGIAGVPPDYFSKTGQLWNMPTYNWGAMTKDGYKWWLARLRKNLERFDLVRLDHFRAFEAYWQSPAGAKNAVEGEWLDGPRTEFFDAVSAELGGLPFVAEDLGDNMEDVYALREKLQLPGMKVLQFAWGENSPTSVDVPHNHPANCIVYTGTHDNNTTLGWYQEETKPEDRSRLEAYTGREVNETNINDVMWRVAYASVADTAILPMQDILQLGADSRINTPGTEMGNWRWRMQPGAVTASLAAKMFELTKIYNR